jgi:hypothetical protein
VTSTAEIERALITALDTIRTRYKPELICPRCGCGMETGWAYSSCIDHPDDESAHIRYCTRFADETCTECDAEMAEEDA